MASVRRPFLTATWRNLVLLTYEIDPEALRDYLPRGLSFDLWQGKCLVSVVGLQFLKTRVLGLPIPIYHSYPEVNLRFYVGRQVEDEWRRGAVFIKQIVPYRAVAMVARRVYHEQFVALPMRHSIDSDSANDQPDRVTYRWRHQGRWEHLEVQDLGAAGHPAAGSIEEFVAEHYWGYNRQPDGSTLEFRVERPSWEIRQAQDFALECDVERLYGTELVRSLTSPPVSAFWAEGSEVAVYRGTKLP